MEELLELILEQRLETCLMMRGPAFDIGPQEDLTKEKKSIVNEEVIADRRRPTGIYETDQLVISTLSNQQ